MGVTLNVVVVGKSGTTSLFYRLQGPMRHLHYTGFPYLTKELN